MAKTLSFTDTSPQTVKIGDTTTSFILVCGNDNVATDLTNVTSITVKLGNASGYLKSATVDPASLTDPTTGQVTVTFTADLMTSLPAGNYYIEVWVVDSNGTSIYPSDGTVGFTINNNIQSTNGSTITTITFDDFVKAMNDAASTIANGKIADGSISPSQVKFIGADQVSLNEITDINPIPFQDNSKALSMSFNPVTSYFSATTATTQPNSGICFKAKRKAGSYTIDFRGVNSNMSGQGVYLSDANGNLKMKWGVYFANSSNESQRLQLGSNVFDLYGIKVGDTFQIVIAIGSSEAGGKTINGYIQLSNNAYPKRDTSLSKEIDNINVDLKQHLYRQNAIIDTLMTRWFSDANYTLNDDGSITYWRNGKNNPGPYYLLTQPVITGETVYVCFEAKKITGELTGVEVQFCNNNVFSNPALGFRLADTVAVRLSNEFEQYIVPIVLDHKWSQQDPSTAGVLISISSSVDQAKVKIRNVAIIHAGSVDVDLGIKTAQSVQAEEAILPELSSGRRKGELLNLDVSESPLPKVHYVSPKSAVSNDNMYLDSLTVNLRTAETVKFAIGSVDQNSLMIKSSDFTLSLPAGTRTIAFKEDIAIPSGSRLFMECHNQGVLYQSDTSTEKILVEDEDHQINTNGYSGYALYESTLMSPFSYRVRGQSVYEMASDAKSSSEANADTNEDLKRSVNILTSPTGKKFAISVGDDGTISTTPMTVSYTHLTLPTICSV